MTLPLPSVEPRWSIGIGRHASPLTFTAAGRATLDRRHTGSDDSFFVADPFLARHTGGWVVFFELLAGDGRGRIAYASSDDGTAWTYRGIALDAPFHLSYPCVFEADRAWYMAPEMVAAGRLDIYRATRFPDRWEAVTTAVADRRLVDPTVFHHGERWWLLAASEDSRCLFAFHASDPDDAWTPHARNPIVVDRARARPGGRPFTIGGRLWRPAQDASRGYGRRVRAVEVLELTPDTYRERHDAAPLGAPSGRGWNAHGMHHVDAQPDPRGGWLVAADGCRHDLMFGYRRLGVRR
jgi:hypothetical protein